MLPRFNHQACNTKQWVRGEAAITKESCVVDGETDSFVRLHGCHLVPLETQLQPREVGREEVASQMRLQGNNHDIEQPRLNLAVPA